MTEYSPCKRVKNYQDDTPFPPYYLFLDVFTPLTAQIPYYRSSILEFIELMMVTEIAKTLEA